MKFNVISIWSKKIKYLVFIDWAILMIFKTDGKSIKFIIFIWSNKNINQT